MFKSETTCFSVVLLTTTLGICPPARGQENATPRKEYRLLATSKTSTAQKEMNEAADAGFRFDGIMGGETSFGGSEVVVIMGRSVPPEGKARYAYLLLATSKTSTMQKELQTAADEGFEYRGQTVFASAFGGNEVVVILERDKETGQSPLYDYRLLATKKTSTMQKEIQEAADQGYEFVAVTVSKTAFGGNELVTIMKRKRQP